MASQEVINELVNRGNRELGRTKTSAALRSLYLEVNGIWTYAEHGLREAIGNTNYQCVLDKLAVAREIIGNTEGKQR